MKYMLLSISMLLTLTGCFSYKAERSTKGIKYISECLYKNFEALDLEGSEEISSKPPFEFTHQGHDVTVSFNQINGATHLFSVKVKGKSSQGEASTVLGFMFSSITEGCKS